MPGLLNKETDECISSDLDLFSTTPSQTAITESYFVNYHPLTSLDRNGPIEFVIRCGNDIYLDLSHTMLYTKSRILKNDGTEISKNSPTTDDELVSPICYFSATQFKNIEVFINGKLISNSDNMQSYRAYLESLLTYSSQAKNGQLQCGLYYQDDGDDLDWFGTEVTEADETENLGLHRRYKITSHSKTFETLGRIHSEIFSQNKLIPGGNEIRIKLHRHEPEFSLFAKSESSSYTISMNTATLMVKQCKVSPHIVESHVRHIQHSTLKYPINKVEMRFFTRSSGINDLSEPNLVNGVLPERIVIGLVDSIAFSGKINKNPFNFKNFGVRTISLKKDGTTVPFEELEFDYANDLYHQGYMSLIHATGKLNQDLGFNIETSQYPHGFALYAFDISPTNQTCDSKNVITEGKISLELRLNAASTVSITTLAFLQYNSTIEIDSKGEVFVDG